MAAVYDTTVKGTWVIIYGDPVEGFTIVGTFEDANTALEFADQWIRNSSYWTIEIETPDDHTGLIA